MQQGLKPWVGKLRFRFNTKQAGHQLATNSMDRTLITSGGTNLIAHTCSNDFAFKAKLDGSIDKIDTKNKFIRVKYNDGTVHYIDLNQKNIRSPDGFYININLKEALSLKVGQKFKKGDILAADENFFHLAGNNTEMYQGTLAKVVLGSTDLTYEDSSLITAEFADKLSAKITMMTTLAVDKNTNITQLVKVGDQIRTSEPLATFEQVLDADETVMKTLQKLSKEFKEEIKDLGQTSKPSKYTGLVADIRIHYNHPLEEYSPTIRKLLNEYIKTHTERSKLMDDVAEDQFLNHHNTGMNESGRAKTEEFDGILFEFYVTITDHSNIGDKASLSVALKNIIADVFERGDEPFTEYRKDQNVDFLVSPLSVVGRMTADFYFQLYLNKILVELTDRSVEIWES